MLHRPPISSWRDILEFCWENKISKFSVSDVLEWFPDKWGGGTKAERMRSASSSLRQMANRGLLELQKAGRKNIYRPISRKQYRKLMRELMHS